MDWVKLTDEFNSIIYDIANTENNYFITGKAGTGKSTLLQYLNITLNNSEIKNRKIEPRKSMVRPPSRHENCICVVSTFYFEICKL